MKPPPRFTRDTVRRPMGDNAYSAGMYRSPRRREEIRGLQQIVIEFAETGASIEARLGVVAVGSVTHNPNNGGYFWAVFLPGMPRTPRPAGDAGKAKDAIAHKVREWCEAAKLISARRP